MAVASPRGPPGEAESQPQLSCAPNLVSQTAPSVQLQNKHKIYSHGQHNLRNCTAHQSSLKTQHVSCALACATPLRVPFMCPCVRALSVYAQNIHIGKFKQIEKKLELPVLTTSPHAIIVVLDKQPRTTGTVACKAPKLRPREKTR